MRALGPRVCAAEHVQCARADSIEPWRLALTVNSRVDLLDTGFKWFHGTVRGHPERCERRAESAALLQVLEAKGDLHVLVSYDGSCWPEAHARHRLLSARCRLDQPLR